MADTFTPLPSRPPPASEVGVIGWLRHNLFSTWYNVLLTGFVVYILWSLLPPIFHWMVTNATLFSAIDAENPAAVCREGEGACWAFIHEWWRFILFGRFPYDEHWRPALSLVIVFGMLLASCDRRMWNKRLLYVWIIGVPVVAILMSGGIFGLTPVPTVNWGGMPLTVGLTVVGTAVAFPMGIVLALGRKSQMPVIRTISVVYIELIRGVPLITVLFMAANILPLFMPTGVSVNGLLRAQIAIILFESAYLAEVIRGGLQAVPKGQYEAADSLGLKFWQKTGLIILPQALRISIPPLVNTFIAFFKDTSLVVIIGLLDLVGAAKNALTNPEWRGFYQESYLFIALIYFICCFSLSKYSQWLEKYVNTGTRR